MRSVSAALESSNSRSVRRIIAPLAHIAPEDQGTPISATTASCQATPNSAIPIASGRSTAASIGTIR